MRPSDVERWVAAVLDRLERGLRIEDDRVEAKLRLTDDPAKAARRIAGHANQAREDRILWVIGVDEKATPPVVGRAPDEPDPAEWWAQVEARFDEVAPEPTWVDVRVDNDRSVLGIGFDTSRPPYVLRLPSENPSREVPWRVGTRVRSANRFDLLKLLVPLVDRPRVSVMDGYVAVDAGRSDHREGPPDRFEWTGLVQLYVDCTAPLVLPDHRCTSVVLFEGHQELELTATPTAPRRPTGEVTSFVGWRPPTALLAEQGDDQVVLTGPAPIRVRLSRIDEVFEASELDLVIGLRVNLQTGGPDPVTVSVTADLQRAVDQPEQHPNRQAFWNVQPDSGRGSRPVEVD